MKQLALFLTIIGLTIGQFSFACDCNSQDEFQKVAAKTEFVALVKVTKYLTYKNIYGVQTPISMEVEIVEIYKGKEKRKKIVVWGGDVNLCRPLLLKFEKGKHYVIAFNKGLDSSDENAQKGEKTSDYFISICGEYWLKADVSKGTAQGWMKEEQTEINLKDLKSKL